MFSDHFVDGEPTVTQLFPQLKLNYENQIPKPRKEIMKHPVLPKNAKKHVTEETVQTSPPIRTPPRKNLQHHPELPLKHQYWLLPGREKCGGCVYKAVSIQKYQKAESLIQGKLRLHGI